MKKNFLLLFLSALFLVPLGIKAQVKSTGLKPTAGHGLFSIMQSNLSLNKKYPALIGTRNVKTAPFKDVTPITPNWGDTPKIKKLLTTSNGSEIWGNVVYADTWTTTNSPYGIYKLGTTNGVDISPLATGAQLQATGGGAYFDGFFHYIYRYSSYGNIYATYYMYNMNTWTQQDTKDVTNYSLIAMDETYDATTGNVYGIFFNSALTGFDLGVIDYNSMSRTTISPVDSTFLCLAANNSGQLYGITANGYLCQLNKTTGAVQTVGYTGIAPEQVIQSATFDPRTNVLYWAACKASGSSGLVVVDTETGNATDVAAFPANQEVVALYIPAPEAKDGAPAKITDLAGNFENGSLSGNITFTLPNTTYSGEALSGNLEYDIVINDGDTIRGNGTAGTTVTYNSTVAAGQTEIAVLTKNAAGYSPKATVNFWAGPDNPKPVKNLKLNISDDNKTASVSWESPGEVGAHGGYVDAANLKYQVIRYPGTITVASRQSETSLTDVLPDSSVDLIYYQVTAYNGELASKPAESNDIAAGDAFVPPYLEDFSTADGWGLYSTIDGNNDGETWQYQSSEQDAVCWYNSSHKLDDWLITPPIKLATDRTYSFSFKTRCEDSSTPERIAVYYGKGSDPTKYTEIVPPTVIDNQKFKTIENIIKVSDAGDYRFAFHAISDADTYLLHVDDISVQPLAVFTAPDSVTSFTVTAGQKGALSADIKFTAPVKTSQGTKLSSISKIEVYRNRKTLVKTFENPSTGAELSLTDNGNDLADGLTTYTVIPYNETGDGVKAQRSVYIGSDIPSFPENVSLSELEENKYHLTWNAPKDGQNGGYVDSASVVYYVFAKDGTKILASGLKNKEYDVQEPDTTDEQQLVYYGVAAENNMGRSDVANSNIIITGKPYTLPFHESFANGQFAYSLWWRSHSGKNSFGLTSNPTSDNDKGAAYWYAASAGDIASLNSGKISLKGAANPKVVFSYYAFPGQSAKIDVIADVDGKTSTALGTIDYSTLTGSNGWRKVTLTIPEALINSNYIALRFRATSNNVQVPVLIDNINVLDVLENNISASISAPSKGKVGKPLSVKVNVENIGEEAADNFKVNLYANNKLVETKDGGTLNSMDKKEYLFSYVPAAIDGEDVTFYAVAQYDDDLDQDDNTSVRALVSIAQTDYPAVTDLKGNTVGSSTKLSWTAPEVKDNTVAEGFEDYDPFIIDGIGDWKLVDGDKATTYGIDGIQYDHQNDAKAFMTFKPSSFGINLDQYDFFKPHAGDQILASFAAVPGRAVNGHNDDWLISPELNGKEQTISFWGKAIMEQYSPEKIQVLSSATTQDTASFTLLNSYDIPASWTEIQQKVSAGTKYFAIRVVTKDELMFMLDDISFIGKDLTLVNYNVYRDGELIGTVPAGTTAYTDNANGTHTYYVSAVYDLGESVLSNPYSNSVTAIDGITTGLSSDLTVYTAGGAIIAKGINAMQKVPAGVYVVRDNISGKVYKLVKK